MQKSMNEVEVYEPMTEKTPSIYDNKRLKDIKAQMEKLHKAEMLFQRMSIKYDHTEVNFIVSNYENERVSLIKDKMLELAARLVAGKLDAFEAYNLIKYEM